MRRRRPAAAFAPLALLLLAFSAPYWLSPSPAAVAVGGQFVRSLAHFLPLPPSWS